MGNKNYNINNENNSLVNKELYSQFELTLHFPINPGDCINSIDIFDDKVVIGNIMGDAYLLRVDENNLDVVENKNKILLNNNIDSEKNNLISKENSLIKNEHSFNKLSNIENQEKNLNNYTKNLNERENEKEAQTIDNTNDISAVMQQTNKIKMLRLNNKLDDKFNKNINSNFSLVRKRNLKIKNIKIINEEKKEFYNNLKDITKIEDEDEKGNENNKINICNNESSKKEIIEKNNIYSKENFHEKKELKKFPQVSKLIDAAQENICCIQFDSEEKLNISIGDFEVLRINDIHMVNMNDPLCNIQYTKIMNYKNSVKHFKYCNNAICMMTSTNYLIIFSKFVGFSSELSLESYKYKNINLVDENIIKGVIQMNNFSIPFDFDSIYFLFIEYISKVDRNICLFDTINNKYFYKHKIGQNFGHISHMKIIFHKENKIFLCRKNLQCEIHLLDKDFTCIESFEHIGNDIINIFIYYSVSKISNDFKKKIIYEKRKNQLILNNDNYEENIKLNNNKKSVLIKINNNDILNANKDNDKIISINNPEFINEFNPLNKNHTITEKDKLYRFTKDIELSKKEDSFNSNIKFMNSEQRNINSKNIAIQIYSTNKNNDEELKVEIKDENRIEKSNKNKLKKELLKLKNNYKKQISEENDYKTEKTDNYFIFIMDNNGDLNMYKNKKNTTLFNLYNVKGINESYKNKKFFDIGYPYYFVVNELYFAITTDYGLFVISNKNKEL